MNTIPLSDPPLIVFKVVASKVSSNALHDVKIGVAKVASNALHDVKIGVDLVYLQGETLPPDQIGFGKRLGHRETDHVLTPLQPCFPSLLKSSTQRHMQRRVSSFGILKMQCCCRTCNMEDGLEHD